MSLLLAYSPGVASYTFTFSGVVLVTGTNKLTRGKIFIPNGIIGFSGSNLLIKSKIFSAIGNISFGGSSLLLKNKIQNMNGNVVISGENNWIYTPVVITKRTRLLLGVGI